MKQLIKLNLNYIDFPKGKVFTTNNWWWEVKNNRTYFYPQICFGIAYPDMVISFPQTPQVNREEWWHWEGMVGIEEVIKNIYASKSNNSADSTSGNQSST